jgi:hypothetical protein
LEALVDELVEASYQTLCIIIIIFGREDFTAMEKPNCSTM